MTMLATFVKLIYNYSIPGYAKAGNTSKMKLKQNSFVSF